MTGDLERRQPYEQSAAVLYERYAGFVSADALTDSEKIVALASLVPMALKVVDEARVTIERLNDEVARLHGRRPMVKSMCQCRHSRPCSPTCSHSGSCDSCLCSED